MADALDRALTAGLADRARHLLAASSPADAAQLLREVVKWQRALNYTKSTKDYEQAEVEFAVAWKRACDFADGLSAVAPELADCATRCKCPSLAQCARRAAGLAAYGVQEVPDVR